MEGQSANKGRDTRARIHDSGTTPLLLHSWTFLDPERDAQISFFSTNLHQ